MKPCRYCQSPIVGRDKRAVFCSNNCKRDWHEAKRKAASVLRRTGRTCIRCGGPVPDGGSGKKVTCSPECRVAWQNEKRQLQRRAIWDATRPPCRQCGGEIPDSRRMGVVYCSVECKRRAMSAYFRARMPGYMRQHLYGITPEE